MDDIADSLEQAFRRLNDYAAVQRGAPRDQAIEAVGRLQESVGIADHARAVIAERIEAIEGAEDPHAGEIVYGVIVGLMAAQLRGEGVGEPNRIVARGQVRRPPRRGGGGGA